MNVYGEQKYSSYYTHGSNVHCVRACMNEDGHDVLAVGGESRLEVLHRDAASSSPEYTVIASFYIGSPITAIAWSSRSTSPSRAASWFLELVVASEDKCLRRLLRSSKQQERVKLFPGGLTGHHGRINDVCFCTSETYQNYVASVGDDGFLVWNLYPRIYDESDKDDGDDVTHMRLDSDQESGDTEDEEIDQALNADLRRQQTKVSMFYSIARMEGENAEARPVVIDDNEEPVRAFNYPIPFSHPLHSIASHPSSANQFMVSDTHGTVYIIDWTKLEEEKPEGWRGHRVVELVDPRALTDHSAWGGAASWKPDDINVIGATYGSHWCIWDTRKLHGGKPIATGMGQEHGGSRFRWSPINSNLFAISSASPLAGPSIKVYRTQSLDTPKELNILPHPNQNRVRDFDWLGVTHPEDSVRAWLAVAIGKRIYFVAAGDPMPVTPDGMDY
ncbi:hypothetical protein FRB94_007625 [Tulasnella sp. JGI-2019a]|nr:hypothetical protein FRB94_007625 [Tulasnella sp. JGI-2019a]